MKKTSYLLSHWITVVLIFIVSICVPEVDANEVIDLQVCLNQTYLPCPDNDTLGNQKPLPNAEVDFMWKRRFFSDKLLANGTTGQNGCVSVAYEDDDGRVTKIYSVINHANFTTTLETKPLNLDQDVTVVNGTSSVLDFGSLAFETEPDDCGNPIRNLTFEVCAKTSECSSDANAFVACYWQRLLLVDKPLTQGITGSDGCLTMPYVDDDDRVNAIYCATNQYSNYSFMLSKSQTLNKDELIGNNITAFDFGTIIDVDPDNDEDNNCTTIASTFEVCVETSCDYSPIQNKTVLCYWKKRFVSDELLARGLTSANGCVNLQYEDDDGSEQNKKDVYCKIDNISTETKEIRSGVMSFGTYRVATSSACDSKSSSSTSRTTIIVVVAIGAVLLFLYVWGSFQPTCVRRQVYSFSFGSKTFSFGRRTDYF